MTKKATFFMEPKKSALVADLYFFILFDEQDDTSAGGPFDNYDQAVEAAQDIVNSEDFNDTNEWTIVKAVVSGKCTKLIQWKETK